MPQFVFGNFLEAELLDDISANATLLHIAVAESQKLPIFAAVDDTQARLVLWDGVNSPEIVAVTENPQTGWMTVVRAEEETSSRPWPAGTQVVCSLTAEMINEAFLAYFDITAILNLNFLKLTGGTLTGYLSLPGDPTFPAHAATKNYVDNILGDKLPLSGGTMLGSINMNNNRILNLPVAASNSEPARKVDLDDAVTALTKVDSDHAGVLNSAGTATAYTVTSNTSYTSLTDGTRISFRAHVSNGVAATFKLNALVAKPLRLNLALALPEGFFRQGMPYDVLYDLGTDSWLVVGASAGVARNRAGDLKWSAIEVDHDDCLLCDGRAIVRADYPTLFATIGTKFGIGNGTTTFNIPNQSGRGLVGRDVATSASTVTVNLTTTATLTTATVASATGITVGQYVLSANVPAGTKVAAINGVNVTLSAAAGTTGTLSTRFSMMSDPAVTGATGGEASHVLVENELPVVTPAGTIGGSITNQINATVLDGGTGGAAIRLTPPLLTVVLNTIATFVGTAFGNGRASNITQPSLVANMFIYVR